MRCMAFMALLWGFAAQADEGDLTGSVAVEVLG